MAEIDLAVSKSILVVLLGASNVLFNAIASWANHFAKAINGKECYDQIISSTYSSIESIPS